MCVLTHRRLDDILNLDFIIFLKCSRVAVFCAYVETISFLTNKRIKVGFRSSHFCGFLDVRATIVESSQFELIILFQHVGQLVGPLALVVREFIVAAVQHLFASVGLCGLAGHGGVNAEGSSVLESRQLETLLVRQLTLGCLAQFSKIRNSSLWHWGPPIVGLAGDSEGLETVFVELTE